MVKGKFVECLMITIYKILRSKHMKTKGRKTIGAVWSSLGLLVTFLLILTLGLVQVYIVPSSTEFPDDEKTEPAKIGERVERGGVALTVVKTSRQSTIGQSQAADEYSNYLIVEVIIETTDRDTAYYCPLYFTVKDRRSALYNDPISKADDAFQSGYLARGEKVRGTVAFEVGKDAQGFVLRYKSSIFLTEGYEPIRVALDN
jgi:hypothetical protein